MHGPGWGRFSQQLGTVARWGVGRQRRVLGGAWLAPSKKALDKVAFLQSKGVVGYNKKKN